MDVGDGVTAVGVGNGVALTASGNGVTADGVGDGVDGGGVGNGVDGVAAWATGSTAAAEPTEVVGGSCWTGELVGDDGEVVAVSDGEVVVVSEGEVGDVVVSDGDVVVVSGEDVVVVVVVSDPGATTTGTSGSLRERRPRRHGRVRVLALDLDRQLLPLGDQFLFVAQRHSRSPPWS